MVERAPQYGIYTVSKGVPRYRSERSLHYASIETENHGVSGKDRMLPLSPGRAESHGFEYKCDETPSLFAALNTSTGQVLGKTGQRHTSAQFVAFLTEVVAASARRAGNSRDLRQRQYPQDGGRPGVSDRPSRGHDALHPHVFSYD
jgi:hypothetical protein